MNAASSPTWPWGDALVKTRSMDDVVLHDNTWKPLRPLPQTKSVCGFDTETKRGYARVLTMSTPWGGESWHHIRSFKDFLRVVWDKRVIRSVNFFYNCDFDFTAIAKHLGKDRITDLAHSTVTSIGPFDIKWVPNKAFSITYRNKHGRARGTVNFYDNAQYYRMSLAAAAKIVGEAKHEFNIGETDWQRLKADEEYRHRFLDYAMADARICRKLGLRIYEAVNRVVPVQKFYSTASIAQTYFLAHLPQPLGIPNKVVLDAAMKAYGGGRFELVQRGRFPECSEIDINSAYPDEMARLPACGDGHGTWRRLPAGSEEDANAAYGFYHVRATTHGDLLAPFMHRDTYAVSYPHGRHEQWIEKSELAFARKRGHGVEILDGFEYKTRGDVWFPFAFIKDELYAKRQEYKRAGLDDLAYVYKIIMNSAYGKTIQLVPDLKLVWELPDGYEQDTVHREIVHDDGSVAFVIKDKFRAGRMYNPVFAAAITARIRTRLLETVYAHNLEKRIIGFATDCMFLDGPAPGSILSDELGGWGLEGAKHGGLYDGVFVGSGVYAMRPRGHACDTDGTDGACKICINHFRGFSTRLSLFEAMRTGDVVHRAVKPVKLRSGARGMVRKDVDGSEYAIGFDSINVFLPDVKRLDPNFDKKRKWHTDVKRVSDLLDTQIGSDPLVVDSWV